MDAKEQDVLLDKEELKKRFKKLYKIDKQWPALIAARLALRVWPLMGVQQHFDFWKQERTQGDRTAGPVKKKKNVLTEEREKVEPAVVDRRVDYILATFWTSGCFVFNSDEVVSQKERSIARIAYVAADAAASAAYTAAASAADAAAYTAAYTAATAATAANAANIAATTVAYIATNTAYTAVTAAANAANAANTAANTAAANAFSFAQKNQLFTDLNFAETGNAFRELVAQPLWDSVPDEINTIYKDKFLPAVNDLIEEVGGTSSESVKALEHALELYESLLVDPKSQWQPTSSVSPENTRNNLDRLNREKLVQGLNSLLTDNDNTEHITIGLMGHWGVGKTRVLDLLRESLKNNNDSGEPFLFGEFNAWAYEHAKNSQAAMAHEVIKAMTSCPHRVPVGHDLPWNIRWHRSFMNGGKSLSWKILIRTRLLFGFAVRKYPVKMWVFVVWLGLFAYLIPEFILPLLSEGGELKNVLDKKGVLDWGMIVGLLLGSWQLPRQVRILFSQPMTKEFLTYLKLPNYLAHIGDIAQMQKDIRLMANIRLGAMVEGNHDWLGKVLPKRRLLFVVDDLDRCGPQGIVKTFEAIRLVLDIPQIYVVVAVDHRIALAALAQHYEKLENHHNLQDAKAIARDYLAKMIQLPIVLGDGDGDTLTGYLSHLWSDEEQDKTQWLHWLNPQEPNLKEKGSTAKPPKPDDIGEQKENSNHEKITEAELAQRVLQAKPREVSSKSEVGMSDQQKAAFYYWSSNFKLTNARQLKRLHNSYNLIRLVSHNEDATVGDPTDEAYCFHYGYLVTLLALECVNSMEMAQHRQHCAQFLRVGNAELLQCLPSEEQRIHLVAARNIIQQAAQVFYANEGGNAFDQLLHYISSFVLPAIDNVSKIEPQSVIKEDAD
ncbi:P-loop NTPase fold protein [Marinibactrum halimedae]|uniref:KAP family P-loop NTPase fold protein n=1 Tax=Marinibactrum halimedae TaxID=1444977 RepID=UPI001E29C211|nr:P-loop NTPase fold protein [Marinibactrum halimedae]MCD9460579.1 KAP family NTPase [Marinibactrum halimedae]